MTIGPGADPIVAPTAGSAIPIVMGPSATSIAGLPGVTRMMAHVAIPVGRSSIVAADQGSAIVVMAIVPPVVRVTTIAVMVHVEMMGVPTDGEGRRHTPEIARCK